MADPISGTAIAQIGTAYVAGLLTVLTPCIYPLIPVTISLFGVTAKLSRFKAFLLSCSYVAGICVTTTCLGLLSAKAKFLFGSMLGNIWVAAALAIFFAILALFSLELIEIPELGRVQNAFSRIGGKGHGGAFLMGTVSGFVAAPCAGPILVGILALATQSESTTWAGVLLFTYALGYGTIFILLGTFSSLTQELPRPGVWMNAIKFLTAAGLFAVSLFLLRPFFEVLSRIPLTTGLAALIAVLALAAGRFSYYRELRGGKFVSALLLAVCVVQLALGGKFEVVDAENLPISQTHVSTTGTWMTSLDDTLADAKTNNKVAIIDFFADWCAACKELSDITFADPTVRIQLREFALGKLDFTTIDDPQQALLDKYGIIGLPAVLFLRADGSEIPESRITGFVAPEDFLKHLKAVQQKAAIK